MTKYKIRHKSLFALIWCDEYGWVPDRTPWIVTYTEKQKSYYTLPVNGYWEPCVRKLKTIIHVNQHIIKSNQKGGTLHPPLTVKTYKSNLKAYQVTIDGPSKVVYSPDKPLNCGARVWIETTSKVTIK